jgi:hypothetical protein
MTEEQEFALEEFVENIRYSAETFIAKYGITDPSEVYQAIETMCVNAQN